MRSIDDHKVNPANDVLNVHAVDEPGSGGANHHYLVEGYKDLHGDADGVEIKFQNGPIAEAGVNGLTHEALISILCDRLRGFQSGPYASDDNALALTHLLGAQAALQRRTLARMARGVEGTHVA